MEDFLFRYLLDYISRQTKETDPTVLMDSDYLTIRYKNSNVYKITIDTLECTKVDSNVSHVLTESQVIHLLELNKNENTLIEVGAPLEGIVPDSNVADCDTKNSVTGQAVETKNKVGSVSIPNSSVFIKADKRE